MPPSGEIPDQNQTLPPRRSLLEASRALDILFPGGHIALPTVCRHTNADIVPDGGGRQALLRGLYRARTTQLHPVGLVQLDPGALVLGGHSFVLLANEALITDQIWPGVHDNPATLRALLDAPRPTIDIPEPCLLVARWGAATWGHWLAEILPKAVAAEHAHPGRFRFCLPADFFLPDFVIDNATTSRYARAVRDSLRDHGIPLDRILPMESTCTYRFANLHAMTPVWSNVAIHPDVAALMRRTVREVAPPPGAGRKLALLRRDVATRAIHNADAIEPILRDAGFTLLDMAPLPYAEQAAAFRQAETVFGVLGSGLTGLIFAPAGVRVASAAPTMWRDVFFHALIQERTGHYADLIGPSLWAGDGIDRDAPFILFPGHLKAGLAALDADRHTPREPILHICGETLPRWRGKIVTELRFAAHDTALPTLGEGWAAPMPDYIASLGRRSTLSFPAPADPSASILELDAFTWLLEPDLVSRPLTVIVNGIKLDPIHIGADTTYVRALPKFCAAGRARIDIVFEHTICQPLLAGDQTDSRPLAIGFRALRLRRAEPESFGIVPLSEPAHAPPTLPRGLQLSALDPAFRAAPHAIMERIRAHGPCTPDSDFDRVILTDLDTARAALTRPDLSVEPARARGHERGATPGIFEDTMLQRDPPEHTKLRALLAHAFTPHHGHAARDQCTRIATALLDTLAHTLADPGTFDARADYATPLAASIITTLLGIDPADRPQLLDWIAALEPCFDPFVAPERITRMHHANDHLRAWFHDRIAQGRTTPPTTSDDPIAKLVEAGSAIGLAPEAVAGTCVLLLAAGISTTSDLIVNGLHLLLTHPDQPPGQYAALIANPDLIDRAVAETLRLEPPIAQYSRIALRDLELHGHPIAAGSRIGISAFATGTDPTIHQNPLSFDLTRPHHTHLAFGAGPHECPGRDLAPIIATTAWTTLFARHPALRLADPKPQRRPSLIFNGLERLDVLT